MELKANYLQQDVVSGNHTIFFIMLRSLYFTQAQYDDLWGYVEDTRPDLKLMIKKFARVNENLARRRYKIRKRAQL